MTAISVIVRSSEIDSIAAKSTLAALEELERAAATGSSSVHATPAVRRHLAKLGAQSGADRDALAAALLGDLPLRVAGDEHGQPVLGRLAAAQRRAERRDVVLERALVAERPGSSARKKCPISKPCGFFVCIGSVIRVAPDRQEVRMLTIAERP